MHDTAFQIGSLAMNIYTDLPTAAVLDVGAQSFNGSLRQSAAKTTEYVGLDIEAGEGVDVVAKPGDPFPVQADHFDLVMATSVFEHDPIFWRTFLEMCRAAKDGGYIYINAPSNGVIHRYPQDSWRFYPDSGRALADWAVSQGYAISLVESFVADRQADIWNDFVAVFRKGRVQSPLPKLLLHENFPCTNVLTWKSSDTLNPRDLPEDMQLIAEANERAAKLATELDAARAEMSQLSEQAAQAAALGAQLRADLEQAKQREQTMSEQFKQREQTMSEQFKQREQEILQQSNEREQASLEQLEEQRKNVDDLREQLSGARARIDAISNDLTLAQRQALMNAEMLARSEDLFAQAKKMHERAQERGKAAEDELSLRLTKSADQVREAESRLRHHFDETARLSELLLDRDMRLQAQADRLERLKKIERALSSAPGWWGLLPAARRRRLQAERLKRRKLFDAAAYLRFNPDVAAEGFDPVEHYLLHGLDEDRRF